MKRALALTGAWIVLVPAVLIGVGCAGWPQGDPTADPTIRAAAKITVQYATLKLIGDSDGRAERVVRVVDMGLQLADNSPASIEELRGQILALVPQDELDLADRLLIANLSELLVTELQRRVGADPRVPVGDIKEVLGWVKEAATLAAPPSDDAEPEPF